MSGSTDNNDARAKAIEYFENGARTFQRLGDHVEAEHCRQAVNALRRFQDHRAIQERLQAALADVAKWQEEAERWRLYGLAIVAALFARAEVEDVRRPDVREAAKKIAAILHELRPGT